MSEHVVIAHILALIAELYQESNLYIIMQTTIEGYYDGNQIVPLAKIENGRHYRVKITFLEELSPDEEARLASSHSDAFEFWNDPREDVYQDYLQS